MAAVLRHAGLGLSDLLTLSELPELDPVDTTWLLVDHNALTGQLTKYGGQIAGCVDHHGDEDVVSKEASPRIIEQCGSCMSLVVDESRQAWDALSRQKMDGADVAAEDETLAKLCLAPILIDTINMTSEDKIRKKDRSAISYLKGKIQDQSFDPNKYFDEISAVKEDISGLTFRDIFRKDYKEWQEGGIKLGISSIVQDLDYLVNKADGTDTLIDELSRWSSERDLDVASLMTASTSDGQFHRHLLVWARNDKALPVLAKFIEISEKLQLEPWGDGALDDGQRRMAWKQGDLTGTRKKVAPLLRDAIRQA